jgi:ATP-binding cassette subfamily B protein
LQRSERRAALQPISLATLIAVAIDGVRSEIDEKAINLYTTLGLDVGLVTGDPGALQEVVWDLIAHAVQVSEPGARVEVSLERVGNEVALRVTDTSVAGPPAESWAAARGKDAVPGGKEAALAGVRRVDLRTVSHILEDHQGRLTVEQAGVAGTSYTVSLPVRAVAPEPAPVAEPGPEGAAKEAEAIDISLAGRRLLVVDDDEDARETLGALLHAYGAEIDSFSSGRAAYEYLHLKTRHASWPDLMVCDIGLPDEDGYTLLRRVRTLEAERHLPLAERMPAIALTGYSRSEDRVRALVAGFQAHVTKPTRSDVLLSTIRRLLGLEFAKEKRQGAT